MMTPKIKVQNSKHRVTDPGPWQDQSELYSAHKISKEKEYAAQLMLSFVYPYFEQQK